jgi:hypothetical protein
MLQRLGLLVLFLAAINSVHADEIQSSTDDAMAAHREVVAAARREFDLLFRNAIRAAARSDQFEQVELLVTARRRFLDAGELPDPMLLSRESYVTKRRESAARVYSAYRNAIELAAKKLDLDGAKAIETKMQAFVRSERAALGLPSEKTHAAPSPTPPPPVASSSPDKVVDTGDYLKDFIERLGSELKVVMAEDTSAKRMQAHRTMLKKFNDELRKRTLAFSFPIENVAELTTDGRLGFLLQLSDPKELHVLRVSARLTSVYEELKREEALAIPKGAVYRISGIGQLSFGSGFGINPTAPKTREIFSFAPDELNPEDFGYGGVQYCICVQDFKVRIEK